MKTARPLTTIALLCVSFTVPARPADTRGASWTEQLEEMGYLMVYVSGINVIQGLNLTRDQAAGLRTLARRMEGVAPSVPSFAAKWPEGRSEIRDSFLELSRVLRARRPVDDALKQRIFRARSLESQLIRDSLRYQPPRAGVLTCVACHAPPGARATTPLAPAALTELATKQRETERAHRQGLYGQRGSMALARLSRDVDAILTNAQEEILEDFSCCLIPPQGLSDPVRIGQAAGADHVVALLERVREMPAERWINAKPFILNRAVALERVKRPDLTKEQADRLSKRLAGRLEKARTLNDVDFGLHKAELAGALHERPQPPSSPFVRSYKRSFFLLLPGLTKVYDELIGSIDREQAALGP